MGASLAVALTGISLVLASTSIALDYYAEDPPGGIENYSEVVKLPPVQEPEEVELAGDEIAKSCLEISKVWKALHISLTRLDAAVDAKDMEAAQKQLEAVREFSKRLINEFEKLAELLPTFSQVVDEGFREHGLDTYISLEEIEKFKQRTLIEGLPETMIEKARKLGLSEEEIKRIRWVFFGLDPEVASGDFTVKLSELRMIILERVIPVLNTLSIAEIEEFTWTEQPWLFGDIQGFVFDCTTWKGLFCVRVEVKYAMIPTPPGVGIIYLSGWTHTDGNGFYGIFDLWPGNYTLTATKPGYFTRTQPVKIEGGRTTEKSFCMSPLGLEGGLIEISRNFKELFKVLTKIEPRIAIMAEEIAKEADKAIEAELHKDLERCIRLYKSIAEAKSKLGEELEPLISEPEHELYMESLESLKSAIEEIFPIIEIAPKERLEEGVLKLTTKLDSLFGVLGKIIASLILPTVSDEDLLQAINR